MTSSTTTTTTSFDFTPQPHWECLSQGAEARLWKVPNYFGNNNNNHNNDTSSSSSFVVIKERFSKKYRHPLLDTKLIKSRVKSEVKCIVKCRSGGGVRTPAIYGVHQNTILFEYIDGVTLRQYLVDVLLNHHNNVKSTSTTTSMYSHLARLMGETIAKTHNCGVVHGDLTTSNMMLMKTKSNDDDDNKNETTAIDTSQIILIDFGLAKVSTSSVVEECAVDLYVLERALLSTHPELEHQSTTTTTELLFMDTILESYKTHAVKADLTLTRLEQVRQRGRKRECFG